MHFWDLAASCLKEDELLSRITDKLAGAKIKLEYRTVIGVPDRIDDVVEFINANYVGPDQAQGQRPNYSKALIAFYLHDAVSVLFHAKGAPERIIGIICGARTTLMVPAAATVGSLNVNFLCLATKLRSMHLAPYMISVLAKEAVERFGTTVAHYAIGRVIRAPNFSRKQLFHRPIHIRSLVAGGFFKDVDVKQYERIYNTFTRMRPVQHVHKWIDAELATELRSLSTVYSAAAYDVYEVLPFERILESPAFHTFVFRDEAGKLTDSFSFYRLDSVGSAGGYRTGHLYAVALSDTRNAHLVTVMETVAAHAMKFNIFDLLTLTDVLPVKDYGSLKCMKGGVSLGYTVFNMAMPAVEAKRNGLVTL